jgi:hypothetical protein
MLWLLSINLPFGILQINPTTHSFVTLQLEFSSLSRQFCPTRYDCFPTYKAELQSIDHISFSSKQIYFCKRLEAQKVKDATLCINKQKRYWSGVSTLFWFILLWNLLKLQDTAGEHGCGVTCWTEHTVTGVRFLVAVFWTTAHWWSLAGDDNYKLIQSLTWGFK